MNCLALGPSSPALRQKATIHLYTNCGTMPERELPPNLLDGNTATKFLCFAPTPTIGVAFQNLGSAVVKTYTLTSANDAPERDPRRWRF